MYNTAQNCTRKIYKILDCSPLIDIFFATQDLTKEQLSMYYIFIYLIIIVIITSFIFHPINNGYGRLSNKIGLDCVGI
jgi:hypothetical protein